MTAAAEVGAEVPISKSEFARRRAVSAARVSQWIGAGQISGEALVGEGRDAQIIESIACAQLKRRRDISQGLGANGISTRLDAPALAPLPTKSDAPVLPFPKGSDLVADQIARERLDQLQRVNRREALEEAAEAGRLTDSAAAAQAAGRMAAQMVTVFEGALPELAGAFATKFEVPHRDALHLLRGEFRKVRASAAALLRRQAQDMPAMVAVEIGTDTTIDDSPDHERRTAGDGSAGEGMGASAAG